MEQNIIIGLSSSEFGLRVLRIAMGTSPRFRYLFPFYTGTTQAQLQQTADEGDLEENERSSTCNQVFGSMKMHNAPSIELLRHRVDYPYGRQDDQRWSYDCVDSLNR